MVPVIDANAGLRTAALRKLKQIPELEAIPALARMPDVNIGRLPVRQSRQGRFAARQTANLAAGQNKTIGSRASSHDHIL
ncbi:hypothetical protein [Rhodopseudomonas sp. P2A-2r]|uniref:hypothetical protein n=1 Tax=unclassified Rhodopseudomonas TaxID=2638247 RepID=UPI002234E843|nr:hypothetical protein [Rhodopseudomonas sp. P2A-2r]UZE48734.1 hypothetical protein ONR75_28935 [Rhodopseudomonas sp. P2A-2r]